MPDTPLPGKQWPGRYARIIIILYVIFLHLVIAILLVKTDFTIRAGKTLGWLPPAERSVEFYHQMMTLAGQGMPVRGDEIVILGDSIMAALPPHDIGPHIRNLAVGGMTTHTLQELLSLLPALATARGAIIGIGVNDLKYRSPEIIAHDFTALLGRLPSTLPLILVAILPVDERNTAIRSRSYLRNQPIITLNAHIEHACQARPLCRFLDNAQAMADSAGNLRNPYHIGDGWHLSSAGNQVLVENLRVVLAQWPESATAPRPVR